MLGKSINFFLILCIFFFWATCIPIDSKTEWWYVGPTTIRIINRELGEDRLISIDTAVAYQETKSNILGFRPIRIDLSKIAQHQLVFPNKRKLCEGDYLRVGKEKLKVEKIGENILFHKQK